MKEAIKQREAAQNAASLGEENKKALNEFKDRANIELTKLERDRRIYEAVNFAKEGHRPSFEYLLGERARDPKDSRLAEMVKWVARETHRGYERSDRARLQPPDLPDPHVQESDEVFRLAKVFVNAHTDAGSRAAAVQFFLLPDMRWEPALKNRFHRWVVESDPSLFAVHGVCDHLRGQNNPNLPTICHSLVD